MKDRAMDVAVNTVLPGLWRLGLVMAAGLLVTLVVWWLARGALRASAGRLTPTAGPSPGDYLSRCSTEQLAVALKTRTLIAECRRLEVDPMQLMMGESVQPTVGGK